MPALYFKEIQYLKKTQLMPLVTIVAALIGAVFLLSFFQHIGLVQPLLPYKLNFVLFRVTEILSVFLLYLIITAMVMKLKVHISEKGVEYKFPPFKNRLHVIKAIDIKELKIVEAHKLRGYHGWSIRRGFGARKGIFMISGSKGIELKLSKGNKVILGTQKPELFLKALERMKNSKLKKNG